MKKTLGVVGTALIICAVLFLFILLFVRISSGNDSPSTDIFGLTVPEPPMWTSYIPYAGGVIASVFEMFSLHGLVVFIIFIPLLILGSWLASSNFTDAKYPSGTKLEKRPAEVEHTSTGTFKKDFGEHLQETIGNTGSIVQITEPFEIMSLILYPDNSSSATVMVDDLIGSFDFNDDVLKVFIWALRDFEQVGQAVLGDQIRTQVNQPIVVRFDLQRPLVTGMVLSCRLGKAAVSETTGEHFIPVIVEKASIVQEPSVKKVNASA